MLTALMQIKGFVQAYVEAVASVLETEVTVVDNEYIRVAGTGEYFSDAGKSISCGSFFETIMKTKKPGILRNACEEKSCMDCEKRQTCRELANLGYPIMLEGSVIGVIGIIAFNQKNREKLVSNSKKLEEFLKYMSVLIESKLLTYRLSQKLANQLQEVIKTEKNANKSRAFFSKDDKTLKMLNIVNKVSRSKSTVLLTGESGTGKEVLAKQIHQHSDRCDKLMIFINCSAIPEQLVESELFGYEEGSFTGAKKGGSMGKFELAHNSTLFLDEIGEMPLHVQTKLLRVLQEQTVERIGGKKPIPVDVRVICATNQNLLSMVEQGTFRQDLFYRLNVIPITIPPLRERRVDIPELVYKFIDEYNVKLKKNITCITQDAIEVIKNYNWPGNVRELKNVIEYLINMVEGDKITVADLPSNLFSRPVKNSKTLSELTDEYEKVILMDYIKKFSHNENKLLIAKELGISRATLYRKLNYHGLLDLYHK